MDADAFCRRYPRLYHMAEAAAWPSVRAHGLLSTSALLDLYGIRGRRRAEIESQRRPEMVAIEHPRHGPALIRDQKPLNEAALARVLRDGLEPADWYRLLNGKVFFWVNPERLRKLLLTYRTRENIVLVLDSARVLADHTARVSLTTINTGYTRRFAQPRGRSTFQPLAVFPERRTLANGRTARVDVAEFAVDYSLARRRALPRGSAPAGVSGPPRAKRPARA